MLSKENRKYAFMAGGVAILAVVVYVIATRIIKVPLTSVSPPSPTPGAPVGALNFQMLLNPTKKLDISKWVGKTIYLDTKSLGKFKAKVTAATPSNSGTDNSIMVTATGPYPADASGVPTPYANVASDYVRVWLL